MLEKIEKTNKNSVLFKQKEKMIKPEQTQQVSQAVIGSLQILVTSGYHELCALVLLSFVLTEING